MTSIGLIFMAYDYVSNHYEFYGYKSNFCLIAGYGLDKKYHLSSVLENNLNKNGLKVKVINASVSGDTSAGGLNRIEWTISEKNIDLILIGLGANDMLRGISPNETEKNLEKTIKKILDKKIQIILAGMVAPDSHGKD